MALPKYDKSKRRKTYKQLPIGAYVLEIKSAKEDPNKSGNGTHLKIAFDIAEGEYKDFYMEQWNNSTSEDKRWPLDAIYYLSVPHSGSQSFVEESWNTFFADLEDSNNGFVFSGDLKTLKGKLIGGKFRNEQSEYNGNIYDHIRLAYTCVADDVRSGNYGSLPKDKLIAPSAPAMQTSPEGFIDIPDSIEDEVPFL